MDYYRLEYNETLGKFRYEPISKRNDERYGWETISLVINITDVTKFLDKINQEFPNINNISTYADFPKASEIKKRFSDYSGISEL